MSRPAALEQRLGHRFGNVELLEQALTHRSHGPQNNERLEFLGDGVLGCAVAEALYARFPGLPEGKLTQLRASLVRKETLAEVGGALDMAALLRMGSASITESILADAVEAVFGAIFLDAGYPAARKAVETAFEPLLTRLDPYAVTKDAKTQLQEMLQARHGSLPEYRVVATHGEAHNRSFDVECAVAALKLTTVGSGRSRQRAEQQAAKAMLEKIGQ
ncbi:MAG TPA: ribonuclease III [Burkholderiales bacterium]